MFIQKPQGMHKGVILIVYEKKIHTHTYAHKQKSQCIRL